jgi:hypothetical protein
VQPEPWLRALITNNNNKAYWLHFEKHQFFRRKSFFPTPSVMEYFGVEIDFKPSSIS